MQNEELDEIPPAEIAFGEWVELCLDEPMSTDRLEYLLLQIRDDYKNDVTLKEPGAILRAMRYCLNFGLSVPDWLRDAFCSAVGMGDKAQIKSWDEAFGKPLRKGRHKSRAMRNDDLNIRAWYGVRHHTDRFKMPKVFDLVGQKLGMGRSACADAYYSYERDLPQNVQNSRKDIPK